MCSEQDVEAYNASLSTYQNCIYLGLGLAVANIFAVRCTAYPAMRNQQWRKLLSIAKLQFVFAGVKLGLGVALLTVLSPVCPASCTCPNSNYAYYPFILIMLSGLWFWRGQMFRKRAMMGLAAQGGAAFAPQIPAPYPATVQPPYQPNPAPAPDAAAGYAPPVATPVYNQPPPAYIQQPADYAFPQHGRRLGDPQTAPQPQPNAQPYPAPHFAQAQPPYNQQQPVQAYSQLTPDPQQPQQPRNPTVYHPIN